MGRRGLLWLELDTTHLESDSLINIFPEESVLLQSESLHFLLTQNHRDVNGGFDIMSYLMAL